ncbi:hypothetical protein MASR1M59_07990 [Melaminivora sp.]
MQSTLNASSEPAVPISLLAAAEVQDSLLTVMHDLQRLEGLLNHATDNLLARFGEATTALSDSVVEGSAELQALRDALRDAVTELQFHDMATQLIAHSGRVLQGCAFRLASETMGDADGESAADVEVMPGRPNPVTQSEMQAGSVELF